tara:strand:- start:514 stop:888 length:375 start_codon:yes stop_codon:yes gene_type:complete
MNILKQLRNLDIIDLKYIYKELYNKNIKGNKKHIISNILSPLNISYKFTVSNVKKLQELRKEQKKLLKERKKLFKIYNRNKKTSICLTHPDELEERQKIDKEIKLIETKINILYKKILKDFPFK